MSYRLLDGKHGYGCERTPELPSLVLTKSASSSPIFVLPPSSLLSSKPTIPASVDSGSITASTPEETLDIKPPATTVPSVGSDPEPVKTTSKPSEATNEPYKAKGLTRGALGGVIVGALAGAFILVIGLIILFKWNRRRQTRAENDNGVLPGPRSKITPAPGVNSYNEDVAHTQMTIRPIAPKRSISLKAIPKTDLSDFRFDKPTLGTTTELSALPSSHRNSVTPTQSPPSELGIPQITINGSPEETDITPTVPDSPVSIPPSSTSAPTTPVKAPLASSQASGRKSPGSLSVTNESEKHNRKSSKLLPLGGPYLTAEQALGQGYWEAEKEQLEADKVVDEKKENVSTNDVDEKRYSDYDAEEWYRTGLTMAAMPKRHTIGSATLRFSGGEDASGDMRPSSSGEGKPIKSGSLPDLGK